MGKNRFGNEFPHLSFCAILVGVLILKNVRTSNLDHLSKRAEKKKGSKDHLIGKIAIRTLYLPTQLPPM